jgi:hypothetical protein
METTMSTLYSRRAFLTRTVGLGAGFAAASALTTLPARAAIPPAIYTIQQNSSHRFLDAWDDGSNDWNVVTRPAQNNPSQQWLVTFDDSGAAMATIMQMSTGRFLDAHEIEPKDFHSVTRPRQTFDKTQIWQVNSVGPAGYEIIQQSSLRFLDAHEYAEKDFGVVTRPRQANPTQRWTLNFIRYA